MGITVDAINDPPKIVGVPAAIGIDEDTTLFLNGFRIGLSDVDTRQGVAKLIVSATHGKVTLNDARASSLASMITCAQFNNSRVLECRAGMNALNQVIFTGFSYS